MNQQPSGYEPDELPDCSIPRYSIFYDKAFRNISQTLCVCLPSCGTRHCARLEHGALVDRGASFCSLHHPQGAFANSPDELPDCSIPRYSIFYDKAFRNISQTLCVCLPSCGARHCARLERGALADRGASFCSLYHPQGAFANSPDELPDCSIPRYIGAFLSA